MITSSRSLHLLDSDFLLLTPISRLVQPASW